MWIFKREADIGKFLAAKKAENQTIGFVPTMGALHEGHISLVCESIKRADFTVCSIFVNPTQFNDKKDLQKYPRTIESDSKALFEAGCDLLFLPEVTDIYPDDSKAKFYDLGSLETVFEGRFRPGHFQGVCQVVDRLFEIVQPDDVFFGQKDYQQCMVIRRMIQMNPEFSAIDMHVVPTLREPSGLAMSSRNMRLSEEERVTAATIHKTLLFLKQHLAPGAVSSLQDEAVKMLTNAGFRPEYAGIGDAETLEPVENWDGTGKLVAVIAAFLGDVRLIDNMVLTD